MYREAFIISFVKTSEAYGKCLRCSLEDIKKHPNRKLMMGPPGRPGDTSHFWTEDRMGKVYDRTPEAVGPNYKYRGREVSPRSIIKELRLN